MSAKKSTLNCLLLIALTQTSAMAQTFDNQERSFNKLFNNHRMAQPKNVPWAGSFYTYGENGIDAQNSAGGSPAQIWDQFNAHPAESSAAEWERRNHTCAGLEGAELEGCQGWWGHCNAWSAAAINHPEPRKSATIKNAKNQSFTFGVGQQKAILTEYWMDSGSLFLGETEKGEEVTPKLIYSDYESLSDYEKSLYRAYWDVTPRAFVLTLMNYIGLRQVGVIIDRYTGAQVWNQPLTGYHILPIRASDLSNNGKTALIRMKIYWAHDGVASDFVSAIFDVQKTSDNEYLESFGESYDGRLLKFYLNFNQPLQLNDQGTLITNADNVKIVDDGKWFHQINPVSGDWIFHQHPDFIWAPTEAYMTSTGYSNPYVKHTDLDALFQLKNVDAPAPTPTPPPVPQPPSTPEVSKMEKWTLTLNSRDLKSVLGSGFGRTKIKNYLDTVLGSNGIEARVTHANILVGPKQSVISGFEVSNAVGANPIVELLKAHSIEATMNKTL